MAELPVLFISHGAPNLVLHPTPAHDFLMELGKKLPKPKAILVISAHFTTQQAALTGDATPTTIYDFGGFEPELYQMTYRAPGSLQLATEIAARLKSFGVPANIVRNRGFDHGTWVPLKLMWPDADIPVVQLSVQPNAGPDHHLAIGKAIAGLADEGILIIGSGALTHNLHELFGNNYVLSSPAPDWVTEFGEWMRDHVERGDTGALLDYRRLAPFGKENHPTEEHLLPLFSALGAAGERMGKRIHSSEQYGVLMMDVYRFGE